MPTGIDPTLAVDLDLVIDQSQHGVLIFQRGRLTYANLRAAQMIGYQPGEIGKLTLGETLTIVHAADRARSDERPSDCTDRQIRPHPA